MNKKTVFKNFLYVIAGIVLAVGISYLASATGTYNDPSGTPPANNPATPLNVGTGDQVKSTGLCGLGACGGLAIDESFIANQNAALSANGYINGLMLGGTAANDGALAFGDSTQKTSVDISGSLNTSETMQANSLENASGNNGLCANAAGQIVLCNIDICSNITGTQTTVPSGYVANTDGTCTPAPKEFYSANQSTITYNNFGGDVVGGDVPSRGIFNGTTDGLDPGVLTTGMPLSFIGGVPNNQQNLWITNEVPGVTQTAFDSNNDPENGNGAPASRLLNVVEKGSYEFKVSGGGSVGISGKRSSDTEFVGVAFYLKVNTSGSDQWYNLASGVKLSGTPPQAIGATPTEADIPTKNQFNNPEVSAFGGQGNGTQSTYFPYSYSFDKTFALNPGDTADIYTYVYGVSGDGGGFLGIGGSYDNFRYYANANPGGSVIHIMEQPAS